MRKLHPDWKRLHQRGDVRALIVGAVVQAAGGAWSALPGAVLDRLPAWAPWAVSGVIFAACLIVSYTRGGDADTP